MSLLTYARYFKLCELLACQELESAKAGRPAHDRVFLDCCERRLAERGVLIDRRGRRLRFGFGIYHDDAFVDALIARTKAALG